MFKPYGANRSSTQSCHRPKILIVASNASAQFGGESFIPLKYFQVLRSKGIPVRLIAHARNRDSLEQELGPDMALVDLIEDTGWHRAIWRAGRVFPTRLSDIVFGQLLNSANEIFQKRLIRKLVAAGQVDVIHQPIPVSPRTPSSLHGFGVPVIIGPMNGGMTYPEGYSEYESRWEKSVVAWSRHMAGLANRLTPGKRKAAALLVANDRTKDALPVAHPRVVRLVENGVDFSIWSPPDSPAPRQNSSFRLVFMGRLTGWKAVDITLQALSKARDRGTEVRLEILGDGEERPRLEAMVKDLSLEEFVTFHGFIEQRDCAPILAGCDALILNSVWECGGAVVLEAMALGLPVIASDWGGPADYLDPSCGILVHPEPRGGFADRLADAIDKLANDPDLRAEMGRAGQKKVQDVFDWDKKVDRILALYREVVADHLQQKK